MLISEGTVRRAQGPPSRRPAWNKLFLTQELLIYGFVFLNGEEKWCVEEPGHLDIGMAAVKTPLPFLRDLHKARPYNLKD